MIGDSDLEAKSDDGVMSVPVPLNSWFNCTTRLFLANASPPMAPTPLDTLKKGFNRLSETINDKRRTLVAKLSRKEAISSSDADWLDQDGNTVDERRILDTLESASDYERAVEILDENGKAIVRKLRELGANMAKVAGNKRKRMVPITLCTNNDISDDIHIGSEHEKTSNTPDRKTAPAPPAPVKFTKKENATLAQRIEILDWYQKNGKNQSATAKHFGPLYPNLQIKQPLISSWIKDKPKWRKQWEQSGHQSDRTAKRSRQTEHPDVSEMMLLWVSKAMGDGILLTGDVLRQKWNIFADLAGIPEDERLKLSNGWLARFKERNNLMQRKRHGEAASASVDTVELERKRVQELIRDSGYELRDIFNMDETGLFYGYAPVSAFSRLSDLIGG